MRTAVTPLWAASRLTVSWTSEKLVLDLEDDDDDAEAAREIESWTDVVVVGASVSAMMMMRSWTPIATDFQTIPEKVGEGAVRVNDDSSFTQNSTQEMAYQQRLLCV